MLSSPLRCCCETGVVIAWRIDMDAGKRVHWRVEVMEPLLIKSDAECFMHRAAQVAAFSIVMLLAKNTRATKTVR